MTIETNLRLNLITVSTCRPWRLMTYRYGRGSSLITINKSVRDGSELMAGDEALTAAILDRLLHNPMSSASSRSYRLRDLENTLTASRADERQTSRFSGRLRVWPRLRSSL